MLISTRGRYALRVLTDLAEHTDSGYVPMKDIAERQGISLKYLERIIPVLSKNGIIEGLQGKGGGYRLVKLPEECKIGAKPCERVSECRTYPLWVEFYRHVNEFFDGKTLADVAKTDVSDHYSI